jgi:hypothetical protein
MGALQAVGGVAEAAAGAAVMPTGVASFGVGTVVGGAIILHGADNTQAGLRQLWTGEKARTNLALGLEAAGFSTQTAERLDIAFGVGAPLGAMAALPRLASPAVTISANELAGIRATYRIDYSRGLRSDLQFDFLPGYQRLPGVLTEDLTLVTYHSGAPVGAGRSLKYWTTPEQANSMATMGDVHRDLALMWNWGERTHVSVARIPAGTEVSGFIGAARAQENWRQGVSVFLPGEGTQIRFTNFDPRWVVETRKLPTGK